MADNSLAHRAQHATRTEAMNLPPKAPPTNHGHTVAAWTTTWVVVIGALVVALAMVFEVTWLIWVGAVMTVLGLVLGKVLQLMGYGQGGAATRARQQGKAGH